MEGLINKASPAMQVAAVVISYLIDMFKKVAGLFSFATDITSIDDSEE